MNELGTYRITDFVLFSKETLFEVYDAYNQQWWPLQIFWILLSFLILSFAKAPSLFRSRILSVILSAAFLWSGSAFLIGQFQSINWVAQYFAYLFFAEAALIFLLGALLGKFEIGSANKFSRLFGLMLFALAAFVPFEIFFDHKLSPVLVFGFGADRTAVGTMGLLIASSAKWLKWILMAPCLIWCLFMLMVFYGFR